MKSEYLSIVLLEDISFKELVEKIEKVFDKKFPYKNEKGRYIAKALKNNHEIKLIDRVDDLSDLLCDEHHTLEIKVNFKDNFDYINFENNLIKQLKETNIKWQRAVWTCLELFENSRVIYPCSR